MIRRIVGLPLAAALVLMISPPTTAQAQAKLDDQLLLDSAGIDAVLLAKFVDGMPLDAAERPALVAVWSGLRQVSQLDLDRDSRKAAKGSDVATIEARGKLWQVSGKLKQVTVEALPAEDQERVYAEIDEIPAGDPRVRTYRCEIELDGGGPTAIVYTLQFPKGIPVDGKLKGDERVSFQGVCLKNVGTADAPQPLFAARHLAWYPHTPLGDLGMDYALYDDVRREAHDLKYERECFYQLMAAMKKADFAKLLQETDAKEPFSVVPLFNAPDTMHGKLIALQGTARRAVAVVVDEPDIAERFGIKQFYEVAVYTADSQQNPLLFNLLELPPDFPQGENIHAQVRIPGTFLTGFYYRRDATSNEQASGTKPTLQKAPLLIGKSLYPIPKAEPMQTSTSWLFAGAIAAALAVLAFVFWRSSRTDETTREFLKRQMTPPAGTSLNDAPVEYQAKPDFSGLDPAPPGDDAER